LRGPAAADARRPGARALGGQTPSQHFLLASSLFLALRLDLPDLPVALAVDVARILPRCLLSEREVEADSGQVAESAH
jgi:hypothetical protein